MNNFIKIAVLNFVFLQLHAQNMPLLDDTNRWILVNNKIDKNEIYLTSYKKTKVKLNTLVLSFAQNGRIVYDYETNSKYDGNSNINYLDINTNESSWSYDSLTHTLVLNMQAGYITIDDFKFKREYKIDDIHEGYILMKEKEIFFEDLKRKKITKAVPSKNLNSPVYQKTVVPTQTQIIPKDTTLIITQTIKDTTSVIAAVLEKTKAQVDTVNVVNVSVETKMIQPEIPVSLPVIVVAPPVKINYFERNKDLLNKTKRWILVRNKIERGDIYLTPYDESKLTINNLVLSLSDEGKIEYDYESDPKIKFCAGVDFLDIDTDETSWAFDGESNVLTLTLKGGYASLDDFKFKRDYTIELFDDGFALRRIKEHYFNDFRKPVKTTVNYSKRKK